MELTGDREKLRRAYLRARKMGLSASLQETLSNRLTGKEKVVEEKTVPPVFVDTKANPTFANKTDEWIFLLSNEKTSNEASEFFLEHAPLILRDLPNIEAEEECWDLFGLLDHIDEPANLLKATTFGRLLEKTDGDEERFSQISSFIESRRKNWISEDTLVLCLFFSDPIPWFTKSQDILNRLSHWTLQCISKLKLARQEGVQEFLIKFIKEKGTSDFKLKLICDQTRLKRLDAEELSSLLILASSLHMTRLVENVKLIQSVRESAKLSDREFMRTVSRFHRATVTDEKILRKCVFEYSLNEKKFLSSYIRIAPWMHYFSQTNVKDYRTLKKMEWFFDPSLRRIYSTLGKLGIKFPPKNLVKKDLFDPHLLAEIPFFYPMVPHNSWGKTLAGFNQIFAVNHLDSVLLRMRTATKSFGDNQFSTWLEESDMDIKLNWQQLQTASLSISDEQAAKLLSRFVSRIASLACKDLSLSLWTLSQEGAPTDLLCDLESWFLREA